jgi:phosphopantothenoylcysteine decarboxylase/phosphopantothenate--cysteine ligase
MKLRVIVTAGPTREYADDVWYLSNGSSGKLGFEIARAARERGHRVTLVAGPVSLDTPAGVRRVDVVSTRDMLEALEEVIGGADALVMAAAPVDYRPRTRRRGKMKKGRDEILMRLVRNPDVLRTVGAAKGRRVFVAFALESGDGAARARRKMKAKRADAIVLNSPAAMGAERQDATLIRADGTERACKGVTKRRLAGVVVREVERLARARPERPEGRKGGRSSSVRSRSK